VHTAMFSGLYQGATQNARIDTKFREEPCVASELKRRLDVRKYIIRQLTSASASRNFATPEESNGPSIAKIDGLARFVLQLLHKFWIQLGTGGNEWLQFLRDVRIATGNHASRGVCG